jgi:hypothetical protein
MSFHRKIAKVRTRGNMTNTKAETRQDATRMAAGLFEIHIKGHLDSSWSDWLEGLEVKLLDNGEMILYGPIPDQAALMGVLNKLYGLNLTLLSLERVGPNE